MTAEVRRGTARFQTREQGRSTWHSFSFGGHYDPENVSFGPLVCHDEHLLRGGEGFPDHPHRDVEIVTWVVTGALEHAGGPAGADGERGVVRPGQVQVLWTGDGVTHAEIAEPGAGPTRFVQAWLRPEPTPEVAPERSVADTDPARGGLVLVASSSDNDARRARCGRRARRSGWPGSTGATPSRCRTPPGCTSSSPGARSPARAWPSRSRPATRSGSATSPGPR